MYEAPKVIDDGPTVAAKVRRALSRDAAIAYLAGKDPRPLLVLRECKVCNGTDDALLSRGNVDNERTFLMSRWFHCVKLPVDVLEKDHPFRNLFRESDAEHMFLCAADGSNKTPLESERSRVELWGAMNSVLKLAYASEPEAQVKKMQRTVDAIDLVDDKLRACERKIDSLLETEGADAPKLKKAKLELETAQNERDELLASIERVTAEFKLKPSVPTAKAAEPKGS